VVATTRKYSLPGHPEPDRYDVLQSAPLDGRPSRLIRRQISVTGVYMGSANIRQDIPVYTELYRQGRLNVDDLVSQEISIEQINDAYRDLAGGHIARSVITRF
jgi:Zn-dependent alcohol dehydrogenase